MTASLAGTLILGIWLFLRLHSLVGRQAQEAAAASLPQSFYNQLAGCASRLELRCIPRVVVTKRLATPAVFGVFRPVLLMPRGYLSKLSRRDTEHMLLHELAHIKRGDLIAHGLYMLLQIVYWYNPLLWLVRRQMHHLRELSCDATVAELLREQTTAYRQTLLETARRLLTSSVEPGLGLLGLFEDSNRLLVRLDWLTKPTWRYKTMKRVTVATIAALMLACVLPMARAQETASNREERVSEQDDSVVAADGETGRRSSTSCGPSRNKCRSSCGPWPRNATRQPDVAGPAEEPGGPGGGRSPGEIRRRHRCDGRAARGACSRGWRRSAGSREEVVRAHAERPRQVERRRAQTGGRQGRRRGPPGQGRGAAEPRRAESAARLVQADARVEPERADAAVAEGHGEVAAADAGLGQGAGTAVRKSHGQGLW